MTKRFPTLVVAFAVALSAPLAAQGRSTVSPADMDAAITTSTSESRARVERFVNTPEVREAAGKLGISQATLSAKVATLDNTTLNAVAQQIDMAPLAGGFSILGIGIVGIAVIILLIVLI